MEAIEVAGKTDRRDDLLTAAATVMGRMGFERMRLRDVASEAGVSIGLLQHYFETREQLGREAFAAICGTRATPFSSEDDGALDRSVWSRQLDGHKLSRDVRVGSTANSLV